jgi:hypothetical protein
MVFPSYETYDSVRFLWRKGYLSYGLAFSSNTALFYLEIFILLSGNFSIESINKFTEL